MENIQATVETLNDLILIHNDRVDGFERALKELGQNNTELHAVFLAMIDQSHQLKLALATEVAAAGKDIETGHTTSGTLHRTWLDIKSKFTGHSTHNIMEECEFGEDAIKKAYASALEEEHLPAFIRQLLQEQQVALQDAHDKIKVLRDSTSE